MLPFSLFSRRSGISWTTAGAVNIVTDGNSLVIQGGGVVGVMMGGSPFSSQTHANVAINGQTIAAMAAATSDVTSSHVAGKQNVLFAQEGTNSIGTGVSPSTAVDQLMAYCAAMQAAKTWTCVVVATTPPAWNGDSFGQSYVDNYNANIDAFNALLRSRYREAADALLDNRASGMPFDSSRFPNYLRATFFDTTVVNGYSNNSLMLTEGDNLRVHYTDACRALMAPQYASIFTSLPRAR